MDDNKITVTVTINTRQQQHRHRVVTFDTNIYEQEYDVIVGAYASVSDTCPLQLTWGHSLLQIVSLNDGQRQRRLHPNKSCQSLSYRPPYKYLKR